MRLFAAVYLFSLSLIFSAALFADGNRTSHPWGGYLSWKGDPNLTELGINIAYNIDPLFRLKAGYGSYVMRKEYSDGAIIEGNVKTFSFGAQAMFPWDFTPTVGVGLCVGQIDNFSGTKSGQSVPTRDYYYDGSNYKDLYLSLGVEYTSPEGIFVAGGFNFSGIFTTTPYLSAGWFY